LGLSIALSPFLPRVFTFKTQNKCPGGWAG
jgi:hypothetical protein